MVGIAPFTSRPASGAAWGAWALVGSAAATAIVLVGWLSTALSNGADALAPRVPVAWLFAALAAAAAVGARGVARDAFGPRALVFTSVASLSMLPAIAIGAMFACERVLVSSSSRRGDSDVLTGALSLVVLGVASLIVLPIAMLFASRHARALDAVLRGAAWIAIAAAIALGAFCAVRTVGRPDADTYLASLPKVVELPPARDVPRFEATNGRVHVQREPSAETDRCPFQLDIAPAPGGAPIHEIVRSGEKPACGRLAIRRDERHDFWIFTDEDGARPQPVLAIAGSSNATETVVVRQVADSLSAPVGWIAQALAAAVVGGTLVFFARRRARPLRLLLGATAATHDGGGALRLADGSAAFHSSAQTLAPGPALVTFVPGDAAGGYRASATPAVANVVAGTHADVRAAIASWEAGGHALALLVVLLATCPLAVAVWIGVR